MTTLPDGYVPITIYVPQGLAEAMRNAILDFQSPEVKNGHKPARKSPGVRKPLRYPTYEAIEAARKRGEIKETSVNALKAHVTRRLA